ncbi:ester cyclase [SAR92 clade bacterium H246]
MTDFASYSPNLQQSDYRFIAPDIEPLLGKRNPRVSANIQTWTRILNARYFGQQEDLDNGLISENYCWYGAWGSQSKSIAYADEQAKLLVYAMSNLDMDFHMFGEGELVANLFYLRGKHDGNYGLVEPSGRDVKVFGTAIARFDKNGRLCEERCLWDEVTFLKQIGVLDTHECGLLESLSRFMSIKSGEVQDSFHLPSMESLIFERDQNMEIGRTNKVRRHINTWERFLNIKYVSQDFSLLEEVMSPEYRWHTFAEQGLDMAISEDRASLRQSLSSIVDEIPDFHFSYQLFGEGNLLLYNVACQYTHAATVFGVPETGRLLRHANIAICEFDDNGRILNEWEMIDYLAAYKHMGVFGIPKNSSSLLSGCSLG